MLVPKFTVEQNEEFIIVVARTPYIKASEADFYLMGCQFKFYCKPYFLRLTFSHPIIENGKEKASFNVDTQEFTFYLPKEQHGQHFDDLDLITKLLEKKKSSQSTKIQVLGSTTNQDNDEDEDDEDNEDEEWEFEQNLESEPTIDELQFKVYYGFNDGYTKFFDGLESEISDIIDIPIIDAITKSERTSVRLGFENLKFDPDRYMENYIYDEEIKEFIKYKCYWEDLIEKKRDLKIKKENNEQVEPLNIEKIEESTLTTTTTNEKTFDPSNLEEYNEITIETQFEEDGTELSKDVISKINSTLEKKIELVGGQNNLESNQDINNNNNKNEKKKLIEFTDEDKEIMRNLPNKDYLIKNEKSILLGLIDIIYSYAYNERINMGDSNIESPWNICKISGTLSCMETFGTLQSSVICCMRRSLAYPLYRNWNLSSKVLQDTKDIFSLGKRGILKALLHIKRILEGHEFKYYLNRLYIDDYCCWLQHASKKKLKSLRNKLLEFQIKKDQMDWPLEEYEKLVEEEGMVFGEEEEELIEEDEEEEIDLIQQDK
eukprot:gene7894-9713_t